MDKDIEIINRVYRRLDTFLAHTQATNIPVDEIEYTRVIGEAKDELGDIINKEMLIKKEELNKKLFKFLCKQRGIAQVKYECRFENGEWDYETMGKIALREHLNIIKRRHKKHLNFYERLFVNQILSIYPNCEEKGDE